MITFVVIDAVHVVNKINPKPAWINTGDDLAKEFTNHIDIRSQNASTVVIVFDTYRDVSLKSATRDDRPIGKQNLRKVPRCFKIESETKIEKISMSEILAPNQTKRSLTHFLMTAGRNHLVKRNVEYFIAGNSIILTSFQEDTIANNQEEADTLLISCLCILNPIDAVVVYSADADVFVLLLKHHDIILCKKIYMKLVSGVVDMTVLHQALGGIFATALLSLHCLTGCDNTGKFAGISKEFWVRRFTNERNNQHLVHSLANFGNGITAEILVQFASFVCKPYRFPRSTKKIPENEIYNLRST